MIGTNWNLVWECLCQPRRHMEFSKRKLFFLIIGFSGVILIILANFIGPYSSNRVYILAANFHNNNLSHLTAFNMNISILPEKSMFKPGAVNNLNNLNNSWIFGRLNNDANNYKANSVNSDHANVLEANSVYDVRNLRKSLIHNNALSRESNEEFVETSYDSNNTATNVREGGEVTLDGEKESEVYNDDENTLEFESERYFADDESGELTPKPLTISDSVVDEKSNKKKVKKEISPTKKNRNDVRDQTRAEVGKALANVASMFIENQPDNIPVETKPIDTEVEDNNENLKKNMHNSERPLDIGLKSQYGKQHLYKKDEFIGFSRTNVQGNGKLSNGQQNYPKDLLANLNHGHTNVENNGKLRKVFLNEAGIKKPVSTREENYGSKQNKVLLNEVGIKRPNYNMDESYGKPGKVLINEDGIKRSDGAVKRMSAREKSSNNVETMMQAVDAGDRFVDNSDVLHSGNKVSNNMHRENTMAEEQVGFVKDPNCQSRPTMAEDILCMKRPKFLPGYRNPCWMEGDMLRCLPYFYIIGVCKTGSTDLFERLSHHPQVVKNHGLLGKETWYWSWNRYGHSNFYRSYRELMSFDEFIDKFDAYNIESITKRQPNGTLYHPGVTGHGDPMDFWDHSSWPMIPQNDPSWTEPNITTPSLVKHVNPNVKLILLLRDPVERLFSNYLHGKFGETADQFHDDVLRSLSLLSSCRESRSMKSCLYDSQIIQDLTVPFSGSFYSIHLKEWLKVFPRKQIFIIRTEDFSTSVANTLLRIFRFLKLDPIPTKDLYRIANMPHFYDTKAKQTAGEIMPETREILETLFEPYNTELAEILNDENFNFNAS